MSRTAIKPGTLVGFLHYDKGTCLMYGAVVAHDTAAGKVTIRRPDGTEYVKSDHPDFLEAHNLNATCGKCGTSVWRNPWRGAHEGIPDVDATGSARCPSGEFHGRQTVVGVGQSADAVFYPSLTG